MFSSIFLQWLQLLLNALRYVIDMRSLRINQGRIFFLCFCICLQIKKDASSTQSVSTLYQYGPKVHKQNIITSISLNRKSEFITLQIGKYKTVSTT